jgi:hypothetical protein
VSKARLDGFLIDVQCVSEENLVVEVDASKISWDEYKALISDLQDILSNIDQEHSAKGWLTRGRSLKASYRRVNAKDRRRHLRFMPFPSRFATTLKNLRAYVYELVADHCLVLESVGNRKVYLLPKHLAPFFVEAVEKINKEVIEPLRQDVEKFRQSPEYLTIQHCLYQHGVDPSILKVATFHLRNYVVDVLPINFGYNIDADDVYAKMKRAEAVKGLEILRSQIERKYREYALNAVSDVVARIMAIAEGLEMKGKRVRNAEEKVDKLIKICESLGFTEICEKILKPLKQVSKARPYKRPKLAEEFFGNKSLMAGVGGELKRFLPIFWGKICLKRYIATVLK